MGNRSKMGPDCRSFGEQGRLSPLFNKRDGNERTSWLVRGKKSNQLGGGGSAMSERPEEKYPTTGCGRGPYPGPLKLWGKKRGEVPIE